MFGWGSGRDTFEREVRMEVEYLTKVYGDDALRIAGEKAARPSNRTGRRKVLDEACRRLSSRPTLARKRLLDRFIGKQASQ